MPLNNSPPPVPNVGESNSRFHAFSAATSRPTALANNLVLGGSNTVPDQYSPHRNSFNTISSFPNTEDNRSSSYVYKHHASVHRHMHSNTRGNRRHRNSNLLNGLINQSDKKFFWKTVGYTNCTEPCGGGQFLWLFLKGILYHNYQLLCIKKCQSGALCNNLTMTFMV